MSDALVSALAGPQEPEYKSSGPEWLRRLGEMANRMRGGGLAPDATTVAGFLPGAGFVQGNQDAGKAREAFNAGNYGQAAVSMGNSMLNTASELPGVGGLAKLAMAVPAGIRTIAGLQGHLDDAFKGVSHFVGEGKNAVTVGKVVVPPAERGKGIGTEFMKDVIEYGDRVGKPVALSPSGDFGGNKSKLMAWYKSLGFQPNTGGKADYSISESMVRPAQEPPKPPGIRAFHGSPHDFDKFDMSKIGTGEGAQAYGHGLYFAENEGVAKGYRDDLSAGRTSTTTPEGQATYAISNFGADGPGAPLKWLERQAASAKHPELKERYTKAAELLRENPNFSSGKMYEVNIAADPEHFLDWDKPLSEQSPKVREAFLKAQTRDDPLLAELLDMSPSGLQMQGMVPDAKGSAGFKTLADDLKSPALASKMLNDAGIPGIKYLDAGSRTAGDGSRNYVVFDDSLIEIAKKYGWVPGMAIPAAMALELQNAQGGNAPQQ